MTVAPPLMIMTLVAAFVIAAVIFARFMRKRSNRHPMENQRERNMDEIKRGVPPKHES